MNLGFMIVVNCQSQLTSKKHKLTDNLFSIWVNQFITDIYVVNFPL